MNLRVDDFLAMGLGVFIIAVAATSALLMRPENLSQLVGQPFIVLASGMVEVIGGAWMGGAIDSTGAVAAACELVGSTAKHVAATVKMIQNILSKLRLRWPSTGSRL